MKLSYRAAVVLGSAATIALVVSMPAQGATASTWRLVLSKHYGAAANFSGYGPGFALSKTDAWAFGGSDLSGGTAPSGVPVAEHWNGTAWRGSALPAGVVGNVEAASADSASDIWAVTYLGGSILHWNGTSWSVSKQVSGGGQFTGVTAISRADVWVFGGGGYLGGLGTWHFNGSTWTQITSANGLARASALSASNIWAVGSVSAPEDSIWHYNGTTWRHVTATALNGLSFGGVLAVSATSIWVAPLPTSAGSKEDFLLNFNGRRWIRVSPPWTIAPSPVASDGHGGLWMYAADSSGKFWLVHRAATGQWSRSEIILGTGGAGGPTPIPGTASWWAFGAKIGATNSNAAIWSS
jgi:hypothetical protein